MRTSDAALAVSTLMRLVSWASSCVVVAIGPSADSSAAAVRVSAVSADASANAGRPATVNCSTSSVLRTTRAAFALAATLPTESTTTTGDSACAGASTKSIVNVAIPPSLRFSVTVTGPHMQVLAP